MFNINSSSNDNSSKKVVNSSTSDENKENKVIDKTERLRDVIKSSHATQVKRKNNKSLKEVENTEHALNKASTTSTSTEVTSQKEKQGLIKFNLGKREPLELENIKKIGEPALFIKRMRAKISEGIGFSSHVNWNEITSKSDDLLKNIIPSLIKKEFKISVNDFILILYKLNKLEEGISAVQSQLTTYSENLDKDKKIDKNERKNIEKLFEQLIKKMHEKFFVLQILDKKLNFYDRRVDFKIKMGHDIIYHLNEIEQDELGYSKISSKINIIKKDIHYATELHGLAIFYEVNHESIKHTKNQSNRLDKEVIDIIQSKISEFRNLEVKNDEIASKLKSVIFSDEQLNKAFNKFNQARNLEKAIQIQEINFKIKSKNSFYIQNMDTQEFQEVFEGLKISEDHFIGIFQSLGEGIEVDLTTEKLKTSFFAKIDKCINLIKQVEEAKNSKLGHSKF